MDSANCSGGDEKGFNPDDDLKGARCAVREGVQGDLKVLVLNNPKDGRLMQKRHRGQDIRSATLGYFRDVNHPSKEISVRHLNRSLSAQGICASKQANNLKVVSR